MQIDSLDLSNLDFYNKYGFNVSELTAKQRLLVEEATTIHGTIYHKNGTVTLPKGYQGVDG